MGNSDNSPNDGKLSLDTSAPLWSAILTEVTKGTKIAQFKPPKDALKTATVDAFTGLKPGPFTRKTVKEFFLPGTVPTQKETFRSAAAVDAATGLLWQEGCEGPKVTRGFFNLSEVESNFPNWQKANMAWGARAAKGSGVRAARRGRAPPTSTTALSPRSDGPGVRRSSRGPSARSTPRRSTAIRSPHPIRPCRRRSASRCRPTRVVGSSGRPDRRRRPKPR